MQAQRFILARLRNRQFFSLDEVNVAIREELEALNNRPMKEYGGQTRRQRFEELDKPYAQQLPAEPFKISRVKLDVLVGHNYHIRFEDHFYSVPYHLATRRRGRISDRPDHRNLSRQYPCLPPPGQARRTSVTPRQREHMPPSHAFVKGWSKEWFIAKATADRSGNRRSGLADHEAEETMFSRALTPSMGVLRLAKVYSPQRLEKACQRATYYKSDNVQGH